MILSRAIASLRRVTRQRLCWLSGHLPVTRHQKHTVQERCFICDCALSPGWHFPVSVVVSQRELRAKASRGWPRRVA